MVEPGGPLNNCFGVVGGEFYVGCSDEHAGGVSPGVEVGATASGILEMVCRLGADWVLTKRVRWRSLGLRCELLPGRLALLACVSGLLRGCGRDGGCPFRASRVVSIRRIVLKGTELTSITASPATAANVSSETHSGNGSLILS